MEYRIFGPPGTGKTTYLSRQVEAAVDKHGKQNLIVASYTRAAAAELVSRDLDLPRDSIGTLHALCYRAMGSPVIAETQAEDFNEKYPQYAVSDAKGDMDEAAVDQSFRTEGDRLYAQYRMQRNRMLPLEELTPDVKGFIMAWESWKMDRELIDFTDMIEYTLRAGEGPPGGQEIGIYDEAQDFNRLELSLVRQWARFQEYVIIAGDDDQCLYSFVGATPDAFLDPPIPAEQKRVLSQSWRVPRKVWERANQWIQRAERREPKEYKPRDYEGEIAEMRYCRYVHPQRAIEEAERLASDGKSVMFLTSCGYMLNTIKAILRENGIPFHNPYRKSRGDWNPLGSSSKGRTATKDRLLSFLAGDGPQFGDLKFWKIDVLARWISVMNSREVLQKGAKQLVEDQIEFPTAYTDEELLALYRRVFKPEHLESAARRDLEWFQSHLLASKRGAVEFPLKILNKRGVEALTRPPKIIISTIHGVKGGEADVVFMFPDLSLPAMREWEQRGEGRESIIRMFYVGMTRAKEKLVLCQPSSAMHVRLT